LFYMVMNPSVRINTNLLLEFCLCSMGTRVLYIINVYWCADFPLKFLRSVFSNNALLWGQWNQSVDDTPEIKLKINSSDRVVAVCTICFATDFEFCIYGFWVILTATVSLNSANKSIFVLVKYCVFFEVRPGFLNIILTSFGFKGLIEWNLVSCDMQQA
jgi:hypothetical protein